MRYKNTRKELLAIKLIIISVVILIGIFLILFLIKSKGNEEPPVVSSIYNEETTQNITETVAEETTTSTPPTTEAPIVIFPGGTTEEPAETTPEATTEEESTTEVAATETLPITTEPPTEPETPAYVTSIEAVYQGFDKMVGDTVAGTEMIVIATFSDGNLTMVSGWRCDMVGQPLVAGMNRFDVYYEGYHSAFELEGHIKPTEPVTLPTTMPPTEATTEEVTEAEITSEYESEAEASSDEDESSASDEASPEESTEETTVEATEPPIQIGHIVWIGDSRYVGMSNYCTGGDVFIARVGCGRQFVSESYNQIIQNAPGNALVFGLGVNDCYNPASAYEYVSLVNQVAAQVSCPVFVQLVIHVNEAKEVAYNYTLTNSNIDQYNSILQAGLAPGIKVINGNDYIAMATDPNITNDGLHFKPEYNSSLYAKLRARVYELL